MSLGLSPAANVSRLIRLHEIAVRSVASGEIEDLVDHILDTVIVATQAEFGVMHIREPQGHLRLISQRGLVAAVTLGDGAAWTETLSQMGLDRGEPIVIEDLRPVLPAASEVVARLTAELDAAVHVLPLVTRDGEAVATIVSGARARQYLTPHLPRGVARYLTHAADFLLLAKATGAAEARLGAAEAARADLQALDERKNRLLATCAHELRQPLTAAVAACEVLAQTRSEALRERARAIIEEQHRHMKRLIEDVSDFSHVSRGTLVIRPERIDVRHVVTQAIDMTRSLVTRRRHTLVVDIPDEAVWLAGDSLRLRQVFSNLLQNAAAYTPPGGRIHLTLRRRSGEVVIRVRDNGAGLEPELLPHLFEAFRRGQDDGGTGSLGVGLAIVRQIVELHGGSIRAMSAGPGFGSTFIVYLPDGQRTAH